MLSNFCDQHMKYLIISIQTLSWNFKDDSFSRLTLKFQVLLQLFFISFHFHTCTEKFSKCAEFLVHRSRSLKRWNNLASPPGHSSNILLQVRNAQLELQSGRNRYRFFARQTQKKELEAHASIFHVLELFFPLFFLRWEIFLMISDSIFP